MSLLSDAKKFEVRSYPRQVITDEEIELALGWLKGEVGIGQVVRVLYPESTGARGKTASAAYRLMLFVREAYRRDFIDIRYK